MKQWQPRVGQAEADQIRSDAYSTVSVRANTPGRRRWRQEGLQLSAMQNDQDEKEWSLQQTETEGGVWEETHMYDSRNGGVQERKAGFRSVCKSLGGYTVRICT